MSLGKPTAQTLRAPTIESGLLDHKEATLLDDDIIQLLNKRFPQGLGGPKASLLLPNELDMARAALTKRQTEVGSFCLEQYSGSIFSDSKLIDPLVDKYSLFLFSDEEESWYRVTPEHSLTELLS